MLEKKVKLITLFTVLIVLLSGCPESPDLLGDIEGTVKDMETNEPIQNALLKLTQSGIIDSTESEYDGSYLFKNIKPGGYLVTASKDIYKTESTNIDVIAAETQQVNFNMVKKPSPDVSVTYLDFGLDLTSGFFVISNNGSGSFSYVITLGNNDWASVNPTAGSIGVQKDTIIVSIKRSALSDANLHTQSILITSVVDGNPVQNIINIYLNGLFDPRSNKHYRIVKIGTQTWMAENLNVGGVFRKDWLIRPTNNGFIEKYCYDDIQENCDIYGGLYTWEEIMQYSFSDTIGDIQGICPSDWHLPAKSEWMTLFNYLGGMSVAGEKLKETGTEHWNSPNYANNESGFTALPGGRLEYPDDQLFFDFYVLEEQGSWWYTHPNTQNSFMMANVLIYIESAGFYANSVRCIKNL